MVVVQPDKKIVAPKVAAFHAAVAKRVTASMSDPSLKPVWQPFLAEMLSQAPRPLSGSRVRQLYGKPTPNKAVDAGQKTRPECATQAAPRSKARLRFASSSPTAGIRWTLAWCGERDGAMVQKCNVV
jgi:hypothetical protein